MFHPMAGMGRVAPPTRFALKARPAFVSLLVAQGLLVVGRFLIMDLWGAMLTLLVVLMGMFVVSSSGGMDTTYCLYYGLMCLVNGIFDLILCVERWMHVKFPLFTQKAPMVYNLASAVFLICPIIELVSAGLAGWIYMDAQEDEARMMMHSYPDFGGVIRTDADASSRSGPRREGSFTPFQGRSHHL